MLHTKQIARSEKHPCNDACSHSGSSQNGWAAKRKYSGLGWKRWFQTWQLVNACVPIGNPTQPPEFCPKNVAKELSKSDNSAKRTEYLRLLKWVKKRQKEAVEMDPPMLSFWVLSLKPCILEEIRSFNYISSWLAKKGFGGSLMILWIFNPRSIKSPANWPRLTKCWLITRQYLPCSG